MVSKTGLDAARQQASSISSRDSFSYRRAGQASESQSGLRATRPARHWGCQGAMACRSSASCSWDRDLSQGHGYRYGGGFCSGREHGHQIAHLEPPACS